MELAVAPKIQLQVHFKKRQTFQVADCDQFLNDTI